MDNIHDIPGSVTIERIRRVLANDIDFLIELDNNELTDMIFFMASTIENSPDAMNTFDLASLMVFQAEANLGKTISYIVAEGEI